MLTFNRLKNLKHRLYIKRNIMKIMFSRLDGWFVFGADPSRVIYVHILFSENKVEITDIMSLIASFLLHIFQPNHQLIDKEDNV